MAQGVYSFGVKSAHGLAGILGIIHIDADDVNPAHKHHILPDFIAYFTPKHSQDNKGRDAQGNGQYHPEAALAYNLTQADTKKVGHGNHSKTAVRISLNCCTGTA